MLPWLASVLGRATVGDDAMSFFFFNDTATTEIYTLSLHDALPISIVIDSSVIIEYLDEIAPVPENFTPRDPDRKSTRLNSSHLGISYAVFCLQKKKPPSWRWHALPATPSWHQLSGRSPPETHLQPC